MFKPRFQFRVRGMLIAVALISAPMLFLRPSPKGDAPIIDVFGPGQIDQDGSIEVQGAVRISQGAWQTEIRARRILAKKDGTVEAAGHGTLSQTTR